MILNIYRYCRWLKPTDDSIKDILALATSLIADITKVNAKMLEPFRWLKPTAMDKHVADTIDCLNFPV